jgi:large subunit ribosomal protein L29
VKIKDLRTLKDDELKAKIVDAKKELLELRVKKSTGSLDKPSRINDLRKGIARAMTILKERQLSESEENK